MIFTVLHYFLFSSAVLIYGIGLNNATIFCDSLSELKLYFVKSVFTVLISTVLSWIIIQQFLIPLRITELYPLAALLVFMTISVFLETIIRITTSTVTSDFCFSFLIVLLALNESVNILDTILISLSSLLSFFCLIPVLYAVNGKINILGITERHANKKSLLLIVLAVIIIIISAGNVSWLTPGVIK